MNKKVVCKGPVDEVCKSIPWKKSIDEKAAGHTDQQKEMIISIDKVNRESGKYETGDVFKSIAGGTFVYLERRETVTRKTHFVAISADGKIMDPDVLHKGNFDRVALTNTTCKNVIAGNNY